MVKEFLQLSSFPSHGLLALHVFALYIHSDEVMEYCMIAPTKLWFFLSKAGVGNSILAFFLAQMTVYTQGKVNLSTNFNSFQPRGCVMEYCRSNSKKGDSCENCDHLLYNVHDLFIYMNGAEESCYSYWIIYRNYHLFHWIVAFFSIWVWSCTF